MALQNLVNEDFVEKAIKQEIDREVAIRFEALKVELLEKLDRDKDTICAGIVLNVVKYVEVQTIGEKVVITIRKIEGE